MLKKWNVTIPKLSGAEPRRAYIHLPDSYYRKPQKRYPVLYMFDGHNVFVDEDATFGKSWGMESYLQGSRKELIVVGVECNHNGNCRLQEYSPVSFENGELGTIPGRGKAYMHWLVYYLKPYIDSHYRTQPDRRHTAIAGSSMGVLMALYAVTAYNHIFQKAACLSPSLWTAPDQLLPMLENTRVRRDTLIYLDYGALELPNHADNLSILTKAANILLSKQVGLTLRLIPDGSHCEASWEKQIPVFMECLGL